MTKERLRKYQKIKRERLQLERRLEEVETWLYYPKIPQLSDMPRGGSTEENAQESMAIYHIELQQLYRDKIEELAKEQLAIEKAIEPLGSTARELMRARYLDGLKWEEVCVRINYSWSQTHLLHAQILRCLAEQEETE